MNVLLPEGACQYSNIPHRMWWSHDSTTSSPWGRLDRIRHTPWWCLPQKGLAHTIVPLPPSGIHMKVMPHTSLISWCREVHCLMLLHHTKPTRAHANIWTRGWQDVVLGFLNYWLIWSYIKYNGNAIHIPILDNVPMVLDVFIVNFFHHVETVTIDTWFLHRLTINAECQLQLHNFPMDKHSCPLIFSSCK